MSKHTHWAERVGDRMVAACGQTWSVKNNQRRWLFWGRCRKCERMRKALKGK